MDLRNPLLEIDLIKFSAQFVNQQTAEIRLNLIVSGTASEMAK